MSQVLEKQLQELMQLSCDECGRDITYDLVGELDIHEIYLSGICDNERCEKQFTIQPTGYERK